MQRTVGLIVKKLDKKTIKMIQNQQPGEDTRKPITELEKELDDIKKKYSDLERIHKYTSERDSERISELLYRPIPSIQPFQDLERSLYEANKLVEKQQEEIRALMNHVKLLEEEKIKMVYLLQKMAFVANKHLRWIFITFISVNTQP